MYLYANETGRINVLERAASKPAVLALYGSEFCAVVKADERRNGVFTCSAKNKRWDRFLN